MPKFKLANYSLFRHRVAIAFIFTFAALLLVLLIAMLLPGGITPAEQTSTVRALSGNMVTVNAPYYWLQMTSIHLLGFTTLAIKLPSIVLGAVLGVCIFLLLRRWLTLAIAVFSALIIFTSTTFLSIVGTGSPVILYLLFPALLLFFGTRVLAHDRGLVPYAILLLITIALALLTPTMIYLVVLAIVIAALNPHVRYGFQRLPAIGLVPLIIGFLLAVSPIAYVVFEHPNALRYILAIPTALSLGSIGNNISTLLQLFGRFLHPGITAGVPAPVVGLSTAGLAILGLYRILRGIYTARAQFIVAWGGIALIIAILDPGYGMLLYLPIVLLASIGLSQLAAIWYRTFPLNPYARISALLPIGVLIGGIVIGSSLRYVNTTLYATGSSELYSHDLQILSKYVATTKLTGITLAVDDSDVTFYHHFENSHVARVVPLSEAASARGPVIAASELSGKHEITRILTDGRANNADRFYVYTSL